MNRSILQVHCDHSLAFTILHYQIHRKVLHKVMAIVVQRFTVQRVQQRMPSPVGHRTASMRLATLSVIVALATERPLIDLALLGARERHSVVLQLNDGLRRLTRHIVNGVLVTQPIGSLDGVVAMPLPVVGLHVAERRVDSALGGDCVRSGGEEFGDDGRLKALGDQAERRTESGTTWLSEKILIIIIIKSLVRESLPAPTTIASNA